MRRLSTGLSGFVLCVVTASCGDASGGATQSAGFATTTLGITRVADDLGSFAVETAGTLASASADAAGEDSMGDPHALPPRAAVEQAAGSRCSDGTCGPGFAASRLPPAHDLSLAKGQLRLQAIGSSSTASITEGGAAPAPVEIEVRGPDADWTATADVHWLKPGSSRGRGWGSATVAFETAGLPPGRHVGHVTARNDVGETATLPFILEVWPSQQRRLVPSEWGVGLSSTPNGDALARTLAVRDSMGGALAWKARADVPWLTVSSSGTTKAGSMLKLSANPSLIETDSLEVGTITVASDSPGVAPARIRVALWRGSTGLGMRKLALHYATVVADRIRPHVYAHAGGSSIDIFHAYTAQKIGTITGAAREAGSMATSPDGSLLYVLDPRARALGVVDLATGRKIDSWPLAGTLSARTPMVAVRPDGVEMVLLGNGTAYSGGLNLGTTPIVGSLAASADGTRIYTQRAIPTTVAAFDIGYQARPSGGTLRTTTLAQRSASTEAGFGSDIATDGASALYAAFDSSNQCVALDPVNLAVVESLSAGDARPNNVEVTGDGRVICGFPTWSALQPDFRVHSPTGATLTSHKITGPYHKLLTGELVVTPDGLAVVALTDDPVMAFVGIGPSPALHAEPAHSPPAAARTGGASLAAAGT